MMSTDMPQLLVEALTAEAFAPFGDVIEARDDREHFPINAGTTERYHDLAAVEPGPEGRVILSIFRGQPRQLPFIVKMMERHPLASQAFIPMSGRPYLVVVAVAGDIPESNQLRAFLAGPHQGVNYAPGVWHHPLLALEATCDFLVVDRKGPGHNCDEVILAQPALIASNACNY